MLVLQNLAIRGAVQAGEMGRMSAVFEVVRNTFQKFCGKNRIHAACISDATEEVAINKLVQTSPQLLLYINSGSIRDLCKKGQKEFCGDSYSPGDSISAAKARRAETMTRPVPNGVVVVRLTGTTGLPFTGTCSISNRSGTSSKSYDDVLPFQMTVENVDSVNCNFISKSDFRHDMKLEILKNGNVIGEANTDAPYGLVGVARDLN